jgi:hypothetical protein
VAKPARGTEAQPWGGAAPGRPEAMGKFLFAGGEKLYLRGVTYGTFRSGEDGSDYPNPAGVEADFGRMACNGVNSVRTYSVPPYHLSSTAAPRSSTTGARRPPAWASASCWPPSAARTSSSTWPAT